MEKLRSFPPVQKVRQNALLVPVSTARLVKKVKRLIFFARGEGSCQLLPDAGLRHERNPLVLYQEDGTQVLKTSPSAAGDSARIKIVCSMTDSDAVLGIKTFSSIIPGVTMSNICDADIFIHSSRSTRTASLLLAKACDVRLFSTDIISAAIRSAALPDEYSNFSPNFQHEPCVDGGFLRNAGVAIWVSPSKDVELLKLLISSSGGFICRCGLGCF